MTFTASKIWSRLTMMKTSIEALDVSEARRPNQETKRVNVDFPVWMIASLDKEARRLEVTRQSIIEV